MKTLHLNKRASRVGYRGVVISDFEVRAFALDELWAPVSTVPAFMGGVKASIEERGLLNPIIVVRAPREEVVRHFKEVKAGLPQGKRAALPPGLPETPVINTIWGGSNRLAAVRELGYTHVDCVIIHDFFTATKVQAQQRGAYNEGENAANAAHEQTK